jgi:hypothetical protein
MDEDEIRPPDEIVNEQLLDDDNKMDDYQREIEEAIFISYQDYTGKQKILKEQEDRIMKEYNEEREKRKEIFRKLLFDLNKLTKLDSEIKNVYDIIEPIIDSYCDQLLNEYQFDKITHEKIFKILGNIRTDKNAIEYLKNILISD